MSNGIAIYKDPDPTSNRRSYRIMFRHMAPYQVAEHVIGLGGNQDWIIHRLMRVSGVATASFKANSCFMVDKADLHDWSRVEYYVLEVIRRNLGWDKINQLYVNTQVYNPLLSKKTSDFSKLKDHII